MPTERGEPTVLERITWSAEVIGHGATLEYSLNYILRVLSELTGISRSHGCSYAQNWSSIPFQRMPNVSLMPGTEDLGEDEVLAATDRAILVEGRGSYSIDQQRYNLQFGGQVFWEIQATCSRVVW